jgi:hypothetical protein
MTVFCMAPPSPTPYKIWKPTRDISNHSTYEYVDVPMIRAFGVVSLIVKSRPAPTARRSGEPNRNGQYRPVREMMPPPSPTPATVLSMNGRMFKPDLVAVTPLVA